MEVTLAEYLHLSVCSLKSYSCAFMRVNSILCAFPHRTPTPHMLFPPCTGASS